MRFSLRLTVGSVATAIVLAATPAYAVTSHHAPSNAAIEAVNKVPGLNADTGVNTSVHTDSNVVDGVTKSGWHLNITLPGSNRTVRATQGLSVYDQGDSSNVVQPTKEDGVRLLTVINNANAPTSYTYRINLPKNGSLQPTQQGGVSVVDSKGAVVSSIDAPWAHDANGSVKTYFQIHGNTITQVVDHHAKGVVYPVVADPSVHFSWWGVTIYFNHIESEIIAASPGVAAAWLGWTGLPGATLAAITAAAAIAVEHGNCFEAWHAWWWAPWQIGWWMYHC